MLRIPDTFIVGAPKAGTTSMYHYLGQHPQVFMAHHKELNFFARDLAFGRKVTDQSEYLRLFEPAADALRIGEASVSYLQSERAPLEIRAFSPDARVLIMLRNPIELVVSLHAQMLWCGGEDRVDLREALDLQRSRRMGARLPSTCRHAPFLQYEQTATFTQNVRRYLEVFGRERVHISFFEQLKSSPETLYASICSFLDVDPTFLPRFDVANTRKVVPNLALVGLGSRMPRLRGAFHVLVPDSLRAPIVDGVGRLTQRQPAKVADAETRLRLARVFRADIEELSELLGIDLVTRWLE